MITIRPFSEADPAAVESLLDRSFGPDRQKKTVYRLREGVPPVTGLGFVAFDNKALRGSLQFWPIQVRPLESDGPPVAAVLLGPLAVEPAYAGRGIGLGLMRVGLQKAKQQGHRIVILVGDLPYYSRVGFHREGAEGLRLPGPVDPNRLLIRELVEGAAAGLEGLIEKPALIGAAGSDATEHREAAP